MGLMSAARYRNVTVRGQSGDTESEEAEAEDVHITSNVEMANTDNQKNIGGRAGIYAIGCGGARRRLALLIGPARHHIPPPTCPVRLARRPRLAPAHRPCFRPPSRLSRSYIHPHSPLDDATMLGQVMLLVATATLLHGQPHLPEFGP